MGLLPNSYCDDESLVTLNGVMYWFMAYTDFFPEQISAQICTFSIVKEQHRQIPLPSELRNSGTISLTL